LRGEADGEKVEAYWGRAAAKSYRAEGKKNRFYDAQQKKMQHFAGTTGFTGETDCQEGSEKKCQKGTVNMCAEEPLPDRTGTGAVV